VKPLDFALLADENIHSEVVKSLVAQGRDIRSIVQEGLGGAAMWTSFAMRTPTGELSSRTTATSECLLTKGASLSRASSI
jgi:hypothetical protein